MASTESGYLTTLYREWAERMAASPDMDVPTLRDVFEQWHKPTREPEDVCYAEVDAGGVPALWAIPIGCAADRVLLYTHGGGFVVGSSATHRKLAGHLAKAAGIRALVLDYRRAPEHQWPAQLEDAVAAYRWLLAQGLSPEHLATAGDSAGGNLCLSLVTRLRELGEPLPAAIMPISPWLDMELTGKTIETRAHVDALVQRPILEAMRSLFLPERYLTDPVINVLRADLSGLPPLLIHAGDHETLLDDTMRLAERAAAAGVDVSFEVAPEMQHVYPCLAGRAPEADQAVRHMGTWLRPHLGLGQ